MVTPQRAKFLKVNIGFIVFLALTISLVEIASSDPYQQYWTENQLVEKVYQLEDVQLIDFAIVNDDLIAQSYDAGLSMGVDIPVKAVGIRCSVGFIDSIGYMYYWEAGEAYEEAKSVAFRLKTPVTVVQLPQVVDAVRLRLDLTNREGDVLNCKDFTVNPKPANTNLVFRLFLYSGVFLLWFFGYLLAPEDRKEKVVGWGKRYALLIFILLLVVIDVCYTVTITWDSGHYLSLSDIIRQGDWANWDPIRYLGFPLLIFASQSVFGHSLIGLLIPMIIQHIVLFLTAYFLLVQLFSPKRDSTRLLFMLLVFIFIAMDPTVIGYYHTLLTEYTAATIAMLSCVVAYQLYQSPKFSKRFFMFTCYFLVMVPLSWHIKQPYIGAALFPFLVFCLMLLIQELNRRTVAYVLICSAAMAGLVLGSTASFKSFLVDQGNPMREERQLSSFVEKRLETRATFWKESPIKAIGAIQKRHLKAINAVKLDENQKMVDFSLTRGFQNTMIAHKMFVGTNELNVDRSKPYNIYTYHLRNTYNSPKWLDQLFLFRIKPSNFLFTLTYLLLPFFTVYQFIRWKRQRTPLDAVLLIMVGTSLLNDLLHLLANQIDRYLFLGYPLNLLVVLMLLIQLFRYQRSSPKQDMTVIRKQKIRSRRGSWNEVPTSHGVEHY